MSKPRVATVWLGGCSGCHMSLLDMDERLLELAATVDIVFSPLMDIKTFPEAVDIALVEGAVANEDHARILRTVRARSTVLVAFGDCAVNGNVTALRNVHHTILPVLQTAYGSDQARIPGLPGAAGVVPRLLDRVQNLRGLVRVDYYLPGCPPSADLIAFVLQQLAAGRRLDLGGQATQG